MTIPSKAAVPTEGSLGVVVKVGKANSVSLAASRHSEEYIQNSPDIYFVFFTDTAMSGPFYASELVQWS